MKSTRRTSLVPLWGALIGGLAALVGVGVVHAANGHFVGTPMCTALGNQVQCVGKVAGLGGTTFLLTITAQGTGDVACTNPGGHVVPGQRFTTEVGGSSGPMPTPRNGHATFNFTTDLPEVPPDACPNAKWSAEVVAVAFATATVTLFEESVVVDVVTVAVE